MLLRNSISNTKRFLRRTFQNFKSLFSTTEYQRLPKATPSPLIHMDTHQTQQSHQWDPEKENAERRRRSQEKDHFHHESPAQQKKKMKQIDKGDSERKNMMISHHQKGRYHEDSDSDSAVRNDGMVEKKLRELEMLDMGNVEYVLDIEEVIHYYSRLTCPAYLEIVDSFFMQIYSEFFSPLSKLPIPNN